MTGYRNHFCLRRLLLLIGLCSFGLVQPSCDGCLGLQDFSIGPIFSPQSQPVPLKIEISSPRSGDVVVRWDAIVRLEVSGMSRVELLVQNEVVASIDSFPFNPITWNTRGYADGPYRLIARAFNRAGSIATDSVDIQLAHTLVISEIEVTGVTDQGEADNPLEVELHLFDDSNRDFLACAGRSSGLAPVQHSDSLYRVQAYFRTSQQPLVFDAISTRRVYLLGIEDDLNPCPDPPNTTGILRDDSLGVSRSFSAADLEQEQVLQFGRIARLKLARNRVADN